MFCRFGGSVSTIYLNDTWSFNISTRKWTELQCTGSIPTPRAGHAAVLLGDVMYVFGGLGGHPIGGTYLGGTYLGDLTALNLSSK
jgi:Galactose oxidase, central domain